MNMSALLAFATTTVAVALFVVRFGTMLTAVAVAVSAMLVPEGVPAFTCKISVELAVAPKARLGSLQVIVPVPPTGGVVGQVHPAGGVMDWKLVFGGVTWVKLAAL